MGVLERGLTPGRRQADAPTNRTGVVSRGVSLPAPWGWVVWLHAKIMNSTRYVEDT